MAIRAAIGHAQALDGREAAASEPVALALVLASHHYPIQMVANGVSAVLSEVPLLGLSTLGEFCGQQCGQRSVLVVLLCGDLQARADWWPGYAEDSRSAAQQVAKWFTTTRPQGILWLAADGMNGDAAQLCQALPAGTFTLFGGLAAGDVSSRRTYQVGGRKSGVNGLAAAWLTGEKLVASVGYGHGWVAMQEYLPVTQSEGLWLQAIDQHTPAEHYANLLGYSAENWRTPPLSHLTRLYPLGVHPGNETQPPPVFSPLCIEAVDGSLQLHANLPVGSRVCLMVGSGEACIQAAENAAQQALTALGNATPILAFVLVDAAWQMLMEAQPGIELMALRRVLGDDIPIVGGYTFGAVTHVRQTAEFLNQHLAVLLLGEA
jgi:hypothetical protein